MGLFNDTCAEFIKVGFPHEALVKEFDGKQGTVSFAIAADANGNGGYYAYIDIDEEYNDGVSVTLYKKIGNYDFNEMLNFLNDLNKAYQGYNFFMLNENTIGLNRALDKSDGVSSVMFLLNSAKHVADKELVQIK